MKRFGVFVLMFCLTAGSAVRADFLGIKKASEFVAMPVHPPLDSAYGIPRTPDSIHIFTFADNGSTTTYSARSTAAPFGDISIDTSSQYGRTKYWLVDQIQDIDGAGANFSLSIQVLTWYNSIPTYSFGTVQVVGDSLEEYLDAARDSAGSGAISAKAVRDTAQYLVTATNVNVAQISGDAAAADSLERMLDGSRATLYLSQLNIVADGNNSAIVATGSGTGNGAILTGGTTGGCGLYSIAGTGSGMHGIFARGDGIAGNGARFTGDPNNNGAGWHCSGGGSNMISTGGPGALFVGNGTDYGTNQKDIWGKWPGLIDDIWDEDTTGHYTSPNLAYTASQTAASGLDSAIVQGAVIAALNADTTARFRQVAIRGHDNDTALIAIGNGSGHGAYFGGNTSSGAGYGLYVRGGAAAGYGLYSYAADGSGAGFVGGSNISSGLYAEGKLYGLNVRGLFLSGHGAYIHSDSGDGLQLSSATGDATAASKHALEILGHEGPNSDAVAVRSNGASSAGMSIWSDDTTAVQIIGSVTSGDGDALHIDVGQGSGRGVNINGDLEVSDSIRADIRTSDTTAIKELAGNNANLFYGPSAAGFGAYAVTVYAVDTSGADTALYGAKISIYSLAGSIIASQSALSGGYNVFNLDADSFAVVAARAGYSFPALDTIVVSGVQADTISGYNISVGSPSSADLCRVYGYFYTIEGEPIEGVEVAAELAESGIRHNTLIVSPYRQSVLTDSSGYFYLDLIPSSLLSPAGAAYRISAGYPAGTIIRKTIQVPDSTVWQLTW